MIEGGFAEQGTRLLHLLPVEPQRSIPYHDIDLVSCLPQRHRRLYTFWRDSSIGGVCGANLENCDLAKENHLQ